MLLLSQFSKNTKKYEQAYYQNIKVKQTLLQNEGENILEILKNRIKYKQGIKRINSSSSRSLTDLDKYH